jgi:hypothetical protein
MWDAVLVDRLRYFINDLDLDDPVWTDAQLKKFVMLGMIQTSDTLQRWNVGPFFFDTIAMTITPDPLFGGSGTNAFTNLSVIKAASFIAGAELKKLGATAGFKITDDRSSIDTTQVLANLKALKEMYDQMYKDAIKDFQEGNKYAGGGILAPYASSEGYPFFGPLYGQEGAWNRWSIR